jgi:hypothetical protein
MLYAARNIDFIAYKAACTLQGKEHFDHYSKLKRTSNTSVLNNTFFALGLGFQIFGHLLCNMQNTAILKYTYHRWS